MLLTFSLATFQPFELEGGFLINSYIIKFWLPTQLYVLIAIFVQIQSKIRTPILTQFAMELQSDADGSTDRTLLAEL